MVEEVGALWEELPLSETSALASTGRVSNKRRGRCLTVRAGCVQVFTITVAHTPGALAAADGLVRSMAPSAKRTYALGGTQKYELALGEVTLSKVSFR